MILSSLSVLPLALAALVVPAEPPPAGLASPSALPLDAAAQADDVTGSARAVPPLDPLRLVAAFDPPSQLFGSGHRGVDLLGHEGQAVRAPLAGTVTTAGSIAGIPVVVISHGETRTTYQPVRAAVGVGDVLAAGDVLGHLTGAASHCAPAHCLHWGLKRGEEYLDPMSLLGARRVRLLPLAEG